MQYIYLLEAICPSTPAPPHQRHKIPVESMPELLAKSKNRSLRQLAEEYGVSHETVRSALKAAAEHQRRGLSVEGADGIL